VRDNFTGIFQAIPSKTQVENIFALLTYAPPEVSHALDDIRRRYDPAFKEGIKPHITIKRPALLGPMPNVANIANQLATITTYIKPFPVVLSGYGTFNNPEASVVFLKVQDETGFRALHLSVIEALDKIYPVSVADRFEGHLYHPHLTIGNGLSELEFAVMQHELDNGSYRLHFAFWITSLTFMVQSDDQKWQTINTFNLSGH
jgi:2'-5' RNA ligase